MKKNYLFELLKMRLKRKGEKSGGFLNSLFLVFLILALGVSVYFNLTGTNDQVVFNFEQQVDSLLYQKFDSVRQEVVNYYKPRMLSYQEFVASKNEELAKLREELKDRDIKIKNLRSKTNIGVNVTDKDVIPVKRVNNMMDSLSTTLTQMLTSQFADSLYNDSVNLVQSLASDSTFIKGVLDKLSGVFLSNGEVQIIDTTSNLKYYGVINLNNDSLFREYVYNIKLKHTTFYKKSGFAKSPDIGLSISTDDPNAELDVETFFMKPPKLNWTIGLSGGGGLYYSDGAVKVGPVLAVTFTKPFINFYSKK